VFPTTAIQIIVEDIARCLATDQDAILIEQLQLVRTVVENGVGTFSFLTAVLPPIAVPIDGFHLQDLVRSGLDRTRLDSPIDQC
jgi:hypothetical protein